MTRTQILERALLSDRDVRLTVVGDPGVDPIAVAEALGIGTHPDNELVLADPTVSQFHCAIEIRDGVVQVADRGSRNGTFVNGVQIDRATVWGRASLQVGATTLALELVASQPARALLGQSSQMRRLRTLIERVAPSDATVLVTGETGSGKTTVAHELHRASRRSGGPLEIVDCAALPAGLIESELFGHERGAFTDALAGRPGAFERAHRGTLVLEEVSALSAEVQAKFLRGVEERRIRRLGGAAEIDVDVRLIATTSRDLAAEAAAGRFRRDLFYRLDVIRLAIPPLRDRPDDVVQLAREFAARFGNGVALDDGELAALAAAPWPGNVRELRATLERAAVTGDRRVLVSAMTAPVLHLHSGEDFRGAKRRVVAEFERAYVRDLLRAAGGNVSAAARLARMDRNHLRALVARYTEGGGEPETP
jgi:DNA-binding NtrC family response regulator